ncbi:MAG: TonB-dependent receptor [Bacteroidales bacterium]|nr:TonB-dependent receptor [Bacteroidales bacterium]
MKKNNCFLWEWNIPGMQKVLRTMKLTIFLLLISVLSVFADKSYSQTQILNLNVNNSTVKEVLKSIEAQSEFYFMYSEKLVDINREVSIVIKDKRINEVLDELFAGTNVSYKIKDRFILLTTPEVTGNDLMAQQQSTVSGRVTDSSGDPLPGVTVIIKGTNSGTITGGDGSYSLSNVPANASLLFSFVGMKPLEVAVAGKNNIDAIMQEETIGLEEVVAVGYGVQKKASLTAAISNMKTDEIERIPTSNLSNVLAGRLSGTFVRSTTGTPGISSDIRVRGIASWNGGSPIYVIDGVVRDKTSFDALDPNEVEEITILKDAASAAIYGSRSSNGVILVTTKRGRSGKMVVEYSSIFGTEKTGKLPEYIPMGKGLHISQSVLGGISEEEIDWVLKNNPGGMNYYNAAYQDPTNQKHSVSISGGSDKVTYFIGGSYFDEHGFLPNVWYKKYNLRSNVSVNITKDLTAELSLSNSYGTRNRFNFTYDYGSADLGNLWGKLLYWDVFAPAYIDEKPVNPGWLGNPVEMMKNGGYWRNNNQQVDALLSLEYKLPFVKGLSVKAAYSRNMNNSYVKNFAKKQLLYNFERSGPNNLMFTDVVTGTSMSGDPGTEYIGNEYTKSDNYQFNTQINFDRHFGDHYINAIAVYEQYEFQGNYFSMYRYNFPLFPKDQFFAASKNNSDWSTNGNEGQDGRLSYIGRINYSYADKYFFSTSIRRDGSVKFAPNKRWGWFPSASASWLVSNENFYENSGLASALNMLKFRFSFGSTGNDGVGGWGWLEQYNIQNSSYYMGSGGGTAMPRLAYGGIPMADLTWEKSHTYNLGVDLQLYRKINFSAEFWKRHTFDILGERVLVLPSEFGGSLPRTNYGVGNTKGIEFELGYHDQVGQDFNYFVKGTFGLATSEVIEKDAAANAQPIDNPVGKTYSYGTGYQATGIIRTQADLDQLPTDYRIFGATPELGMMNFADINGADGTPDGKIDSYDRIILGKYMGANNAPISYGLQVNFEYKNFTVDMLFAGLSGFKITYNDAWSRNFGGGGKIPKYHDDAWSTDNPDGSTPKLFPWGDARANGYTQASTFNTYDGTFLRMKNLNIGYNIPANLYKKIGISNAQLFVSGTNLFYWSKFKFYDPEINGFMSYPIMKTYSLGLNVQF